MKSIPYEGFALYDLSWREYAKGETGTYGVIRSQSHKVSLEREAALSLFGALDAGEDFYDVTLVRSDTMTYRAKESCSGTKGTA